jgi:GntR family transcriptional regulator
MSIDRYGATPLYQQLKAILLEKIASGEFPPQSRLPSERELSETYNMSRMTVRQAFSELAQEGWIYTQQGKGTFVNAQKFSQPLVITGFTERMRALGFKPSSTIIDQHIEEASGDVANQLTLLPGSPVFFIHRVRHADGVPILLERAYVSLELCPRVADHDYSQQSLYEVLRSGCNINLLRADQTLEAVLARPEEARLLQLKLPAALMLRLRVTYTSTSEPIEYVRGLYRGDRYKFGISLYE